MKRFLSIFLAIFALTFAACTNSEEDGGANGNGSISNNENLSVNITNLIFSAEAGSKTITLKASAEWTAQLVNDRANDWCTISPSQGIAGDNFILVKVTENTSPDERSASLMIKSKSQQQVVKITQKQMDALTVTSSVFEVEAEGGEVEIEVKANVDFDYIIDPEAEDWVTFKATRALESSTLVFEVAENEDMEKREAQILFTDGYLEELVTIYQEGNEPTIILSKNEYTVSDKGETIAVEVKSNVDVAVEIPSDVDWVKENSTRAMSTNTYYFEVSPNEDYNSRSTSIKFTNKENNLSETVTITQVQKDAIVIAKDSYTVDNDGGEIDIEVGHNVDFDVEISHDWITKTSTRAFETETLTFNIAANNSDDSREGTIKFISKDKSITQTVKVVQKGKPTKPANNEIWYTTTDGKILDPDEPGAFGANIVSNTYENGKGVITFDGSVTAIGEYAFSFCSSLKSVTIPDSVTTIGEGAFQYCSSLTSITISNSVTTIGEEAFYYCKSLTNITIPDSVTTIGVRAFDYCSSLKSVTIPDSVTTIENGAFSYCSSLTSVTIPNSVTEIGVSAFYYCSSLTSVTIPDSVTEIGGSAFYYCSNLTSVTIPDSVTTIGNAAFSGCSSLKAFYGKFAADGGRCLIKDNTIIAYAEASGTIYTIPDSVTTIGNDAFQGCKSLTSVTIPDSVTKIGVCAFLFCSSLTNITIPDSVTVIGNNAFYYCKSLTSVYCKPTTPPSGSSLMFDSNASGRKIYVPKNSVTAYKTADYWENYADAIVADTSGDGEQDDEQDPTKPAKNEIWYTTTDGKLLNPYKPRAFGANIVSNTYENGKGVITFDGNVTKIGSSAFYDCSRLTTITIPDSVTVIGEDAFYYCNSLTNVTIPDSVTEIGYYAFQGCRSLTTITIPNSVTKIDGYTFLYCSSLTSVTIPDSVTYLGYGVFSACNNLKAFYGKFASADNRCLIIDGVLHSFASAGLTSYAIPNGVTVIGEDAFWSCSSLTSITIPDSVTEIGLCTFSKCSSLKSITIPDRVYYIGNEAFSDCSSLTSITIPITRIGLGVFENCKNLKAFYGGLASADNRCLISDGVLVAFAPAELTSYSIPNGVTEIGWGAFSSCSSLKSVTIPDSVTKIVAIAFSECSSLKNVYCKPKTPPTANTYTLASWYAFHNNASGRKIYVPKNSVSAYKAATGWNEYADAIVGYDF